MDIRTATPDDLDALGALTGQAYNKSPAVVVEGLRRVDLGELHLAVDGHEIVAVVRAAPVGQFFGGAAVGTADIRNVVVAAHARSRGLLKALLHDVLEVSRSAGVPLSTLTPSAVTAYRRAGYENAGTLVGYRVPVDQVPARRDDGVEPWGDDDLDEVMACYRRFASAHNGPLDRTPAWWHQHVLDPPGGATQYRYLVRRGGQVTGYVIYSQTPADGDIPYYYRLDCRDLVWTDEESLRSLLGFVAGNRALATELRWMGPAQEPIALLFDEHVVTRTMSRPWMLRLLDPAAALEARGYPMGVAGQVRLTVTDPYLEPGARSLAIEFEDGKAHVSPAEAASARTHVGTLASLFSGWLAPSQAVALGRLTGASDQDMAVLTAAFAGPEPWAMDLV
ncbi:MAG TPA: GNAT family N-acetyltransferase [Nitriliruptorales bacterium]